MAGLNLINLGTTANDRTGDDWRSGGTKINEQFTELFADVSALQGDQPFNLITVNSISDFPTPVAGVIELVVDPGGSYVYEIGALEISSSNVFTITGGNIVIRGVHRTASGLTSTSTSTMFTCVNGAFFQEFVNFTCANAQWVDFTNPAAGIASFVGQNVIIRDCDTLGTISGAFVTSLRTMTVVDTQTGGFTWVGTANGQINISNFLGLSWAGTLLDLGTATFGIVDISSNCRFISPSGTTTLSGLSSSGNLTATGRGLVAGNIFNGIGTALSGIDTQDIKWEFTNNIFADGSTINSRDLMDAFLTSSTTVTIGTADVYVAIGGVNWSTDISDRFTVTTAGICEYVGINPIEAAISSHSTVEKSGGGADVVCTKIAIDTGSGFVVSDKTMGCTQNSTPTGVASIGLFTLNNGDKIQVFTANVDSTSDVIVSQSTIIISGDS